MLTTVGLKHLYVDLIKIKVKVKKARVNVAVIFGMTQKTYFRLSTY